MAKMLERYMRFTSDTESPQMYHRWCFLSAVGAALGRRVYLPFGSKNIYPNMFVLLVGVPGTRKSSAISIVKGILGSADYAYFSFSKTTKQKFVLDLRDGYDIKKPDGQLNMAAVLDSAMGDAPPKPREVYVAEDEFVNFTGLNNIEFLNLLTTLWDNLPSYEERLKNSECVSVYKPTVNILGGTTNESLKAALPQEVIGQGFLSRMILVHSDPSGRRITWPSPPSEQEKFALAEFFKQLMKLEGKIVVSDEAYRAVDDIYQSWTNLEDTRLTYYCGRRLDHMLKLAIILAACDLRLELQLQDVVEANTILTYTERSMDKALGEFGKSKYSAAMEACLQALATNGPLDMQELFTHCQSLVDKFGDMREVLVNLQAAGKIESANGKFLLKKVLVARSNVHTDFRKYLPEGKHV